MASTAPVPRSHVTPRAHLTPRRDTHPHNNYATTPRIQQRIMKPNSSRKSVGEGSTPRGSTANMPVAAGSTPRRYSDQMPSAAAASVDASYQEDEAGFNLRRADFPCLSGTDDRLAPLPAPRYMCPGMRPATPQRGAYATVLRPELTGSQASETLTRARSHSDLAQPQGAERGRRMSAPQPCYTQRSSSEDASYLSALDPVSAAGRKAQKVAEARYRILTLQDRMVTTAMQCKAQGERRDLNLVQGFLSDHQEMMADIHDVFGSEHDLPGYAALTLILRALPHQNGCPLTSEPACSNFPPSNAGFAFAPVPTTPDSHRRSSLGESSEARARSGSASVPTPRRYSMPSSKSVPTLEPLQQAANKAAPAAAAEEKKKSRRVSTYKVVNPQTGEEYAIKTGTSFMWSKTKRLPIVDPKTGIEYVPTGWQSAVKSERCISPREMQIHDQRPARCSVASTCNSGSGVESLDEERMSAESLMHSFACEPFCGGSWDWPLSRQEKKERILWLTQLELLSELDELRYPESGGANKTPMRN